MSESHDRVTFVWHRALVFPDVGSVEPGVTISVDAETAVRLLSSRYFKAAEPSAMNDDEGANNGDR